MKEERNEVNDSSSKLGSTCVVHTPDAGSQQNDVRRASHL